MLEWQTIQSIYNITNKLSTQQTSEGLEKRWFNNAEKEKNKPDSIIEQEDTPIVCFKIRMKNTKDLETEHFLSEGLA